MSSGIPLALLQAAPNVACSEAVLAELLIGGAPLQDLLEVQAFW